LRTYDYLAYSPCGFHRIQYYEWGDPTNPPIICVHGLARHARDFDEIARVLAKDYWVICPDLAGRGHSDRLLDPTFYTLPQYIQDMAMLLAHLQITQTDWIGTSLGGLIGMSLAAAPFSPIKRLILNDVGPFIHRLVLEDLIQGFLNEPIFDSFDALFVFFKKNYTSWGNLTDEQLRTMAEHDHIVQSDGRLKRLYDPKIVNNLLAHRNEDLNVWPIWPQVQCPTFVLHGTKSLLLTTDIITGMRAIKPDLEIVEIPECGHIPSLMVPEQHRMIQDWLQQAYRQ